jgi:putative aminopeptidase FrvX
MTPLTGMSLLQELCETPAVPGREQSMIRLMERQLRLSCAEVRVDGFGNVIGLKRAGKPAAKGARPLKVMIAGHMNEIGFVVSHIDKKGFLRFALRGGHVPKVLYSQRVRIIGRREVTGIVEGPPAFLGQPEEMLKAAEIKNLFIDIGLGARAVANLVSVGDPIVLDRGFSEQGECRISKAFDTPDVPEHQRVSTLGGGVAIKINDSATISNHGIVEFMKTLATKNKIKHQMEILPFGGTDAMGMQHFGQGPVCTLSVPTRYVHSPNEMIHQADLEATVKLLVRFLENAQAGRPEF